MNIFKNILVQSTRKGAMQTQMSTKITWESYCNADSESAALGEGLESLHL